MHDPDQNEEFEGMEDYDQTQPDEWTDADDDDLDYDFEDDRICSYPCRECGEVDDEDLDEDD